MTEVVSSGTINGDFTGAITPAYTLIKTEMNGASEADSLMQLFDYLGATHIGPDSSASQGDNTMYISNIPSFWSEVGLPAKSRLAVMTDVGLGIGVTDFSGSYGPISFSDERAVNGYSNLNGFTDGGLFISMSPSSQDLGANYHTKTYDKGVHVRVDFYSRGVLHLFFTNTSEVFFFHSANFAAPFGRVAKGSRRVDIKYFCEPYKIYLLRSKVSIARGIVKDAVGGLATDCKVFMYRRSNGELLGSAISDAFGNYEMMTTALTGDLVFMTCLDNDVSPDFEGLIYDRITV